MTDNTLHFERGDKSAAQLQEALNEIAAELGSPDSEATTLAAQAGFEPSDLAGVSFEAGDDKQQLDPLSAGIIIAVVGPVAANVVNKFWNDVVWPRLKKKRGSNSLGERTDDEEHDG